MYRANRSQLIETVNKWRSSAVYRDEDSRLQLEGQISSLEWLGEAEDITLPAPVATRWGSEGDIYEGASFEDIASEISEADLREICGYLDENASISDAVIELVTENEAQILFIAERAGDEVFAIQYDSGRLFAARAEIEEQLLDEGLISMYHLQVNSGDQYAPVIPGFAPIEGRLFEAAHAAEVLRSTLIEFAEDEAKDLLGLIEEYILDVTEAIADITTDETITEREQGFILDTFEGVYGGIAEAAREFFLQ